MSTGVLTMLMLDRSVFVCVLHYALIGRTADQLILLTLMFNWPSLLPYGCTCAEHGTAVLMLSVSLTVCNVEVPWTFRSGYFTVNTWTMSLKSRLFRAPRMTVWSTTPNLLWNTDLAVFSKKPALSLSWTK